MQWLCGPVVLIWNNIICIDECRTFNLTFEIAPKEKTNCKGLWLLNEAEAIFTDDTQKETE